jgi:C-terminal processing protease CtpA/Prc
MRKRLTYVTALLLLSSCATTPREELAPSRCLTERPDILAKRETIFAKDAATMWTISAHEEGIGASVDRRDGITRLVKFVPGGPALMSQLRESDVLTCIAPDAKAPFYSVSHLSLEDVVSLIRGEPGSSVTLRVVRDSTTRDITLARQRVRSGY